LVAVALLSGGQVVVLANAVYAGFAAGDAGYQVRIVEVLGAPVSVLRAFDGQVFAVDDVLMT